MRIFYYCKINSNDKVIFLQLLLDKKRDLSRSQQHDTHVFIKYLSLMWFHSLHIARKTWLMIIINLSIHYCLIIWLTAQSNKCWKKLWKYKSWLSRTPGDFCKLLAVYNNIKKEQQADLSHLKTINQHIFAFW